MSVASVIELATLYDIIRRLCIQTYPLIHLGQIVRNPLVMHGTADGRFFIPRTVRHEAYISVQIQISFIIQRDGIFRIRRSFRIAVGPFLEIIILICDLDDAAALRQVQLGQVLQVVLRCADRHRLRALAVGIRRHPGAGYTPLEILAVIPVAHLEQSGQLAAGCGTVHLHRIPLAPVIIRRPVTLSGDIDIKEPLDIRLVHLHRTLSRHAGQRLIAVTVHQLLPAHLHQITRAAGIAPHIGIIDHRHFGHFHVRDLRQLIDQDITLVTQLICYRTGVHLDNIYLLV